MKRKFVKQPVTASRKGRGKSRVVAIQFDVEMPEGQSAEKFIEAVDNFISRQYKNDFNILGPASIEDLTSIYQKSYPDLLEFQ